MRTSKYINLFLLASLLNVGCGGEESSFSLLSDEDSFKQTTGTANSKVDILWVIDNSGSMESSQQNVTNNLNSFIQDFATKGLDFKMAVTTTDAWRTQYNGNQNCSRFRDGILNSSCNTLSTKTYTGTRVVTPLTPNLINTFVINASQTDTVNNIYGSADERAFASLKAALDQPLNAGFVRADSFLSVIIVSDEDDFSHSKSNFNESYSNPDLYSISYFTNYLDTLTSSTAENRRYHVNAMAIYDTACLNALNSEFPGRKIGQRYSQLVDAVNASHPTPETRGKKTSLCGNFAEDLEDIASGILTLANRFTLARLPIPESIVVVVNGSTVPNRDTNPIGDGGWVYEAETNSILFIGTNYIPPAGASIKVNYDPVGYGQ